MVLLGVDDDPRWAQMALPQAGDWVKLRNVAACVIEGQIQVRDPATLLQHVPHSSTETQCHTSPLLRAQAWLCDPCSPAKTWLSTTVDPGII